MGNFKVLKSEITFFVNNLIDLELYLNKYLYLTIN